MKKKPVILSILFLFIVFTSFSSGKKKLAVSFFVEDDIYIGDGTACAECNELPTKVQLIEDYKHDIVILPLATSGYSMLVSGNGTVVTTSDTETIHYFECWIEHDPVKTVKYYVP